MPRPDLPTLLLVLLGISACAPGPTGAPVARTNPAPLPGHGVVVAMRPMPEGEPDIRRLILAAVTDGAPPAGPATPQPASFEFLIREDGGQTVSVVQTNEQSLHPGERVVLSPGARTHLARTAD